MKFSMDSMLSRRNAEAFDRVRERDKLEALVYDILPSTTAVFSYVIGSRKLSANEQFLVGAQTVVSLLQTTQYDDEVMLNILRCQLTY